ncbi:MAG: hypothetical protein PHF57_12340, partial [Methanoregula sp.]|nr:hypothetical protein [Methanoregula sp.]
ISRQEARQKYPNLDLAELTPEEEMKMDAEFAARKPAAPTFGGFGQQLPAQEQAIGNVQNPVERTEVLSQTERELLAASRQCKADVMRIVKKQVGRIEP